MGKWVRDENKEELISENENKCGLTKQEEIVMDKLLDCYNEFLKLTRKHPDELRNFVDGVHRIQDVLALRVIRRCYPKGWPSYKEINVE